MSELPPDAAALLERARHAHGPNHADRERVLAGLHATLGVSTAVAIAAGTAATASATASAAEGAALAPSALGMKGALVGWKGALLSWNAGKVMLATVALGSAVGVGSVALQTSTSAPREQRPAPVVSAAQPATRSAQGADEESPAIELRKQSGGRAESAAEANRALVMQAATTRGATPKSAPPADGQIVRTAAGEPSGAPLGAAAAAPRHAGERASATAASERRGAALRSPAAQLASSTRVKGDQHRTVSRRASARAETRSSSRHRSAERSARIEAASSESAARALQANAQSETAAVAAQVADAPRRAEGREDTATAAAGEGSGAQLEHTGEVSLLRSALTSLRDDDAARALSLLADHAARYPSGTFTTERRGLRVLALCAAGLQAEGRREQSAFLREAGSSPIAARVRTACGKDAK
jgi:hypothetical protein